MPRKANNPQNLKPFKKGSKRASDAGKKSKRRPLDAEWRDKLQEALGGGDRTTLDAIYGILLREAKDGNMKAIETLLDRAFGKSKQGIELSGANGGPIEQTNIIYTVVDTETDTD